MRKEPYRTYAIMLLTFLFSYFLFVLPAFGDETIGGTLSHSQANVIGYNADNRGWVATHFTPTVSGSFTSGQVSAQLAAGARSFTVEVRTDNGGVPSNTVIADSSVITPTVASDGCPSVSLLAVPLGTRAGVTAAEK